jgi:hypothetical protein
MELILALALMLLVTVALALGVMLRGEPLRNSCSGLSCLPDDARCAGCPRRLSSESARPDKGRSHANG